MTVQQRDGSIVNFVVTPTTYFVDHTMVKIGDPIVVFYDALAPVPLIFPPQATPCRIIVICQKIYPYNTYTLLAVCNY